MAPIVIMEQQHAVQHLLPTQKGINLSMLIDFLLQKTYHDLTILSDLLPRKSDIERKIEIIQFATKARQQFIRLLALVKWASSEDRIDKFQSISSCFDQQNAYFIDTADTLARIARETLVQARLPNFSLPTAVDVLTTGTFNRLPKCIKTRIVPDDPISASDKAQTLKLLNEVIQNRLVSSKIPPQFTDVKIGDGKLVLRVEHEFEVALMLMGDKTDIPWRLLNIEFLMEEYETGDGRSLVHGMQVHFIHQIVQSRLMVEENPLMDLYDTLHHFCLSLQLEVFHTQCKRLIGQRWGDFVKIEEYVPSEKLRISFCRSGVTLNRQQQNDVNKSPSIEITLSKDNKTALILRSSSESKKNNAKKNNQLSGTHGGEDCVQGGIYLSSNCLSIEKIFSYAVRSYSLSQLKILKTKLSSDDIFFRENVTLNEEIPCLRIKPFQRCVHSELVLITVDRRSGKFCINMSSNKESMLKQIQGLLQQDLAKFKTDFHNLRCTLFLEKCRQSVTMQPVFIHDKLPITVPNTHALTELPPTRLYCQFKYFSDYFLITTVSVDIDAPTKPIQDKYYLLQLKDVDTMTLGRPSSVSIVDDKSTVMEGARPGNFFQLNPDGITKRLQTKAKTLTTNLSPNDSLRKRKEMMDRNVTHQNKRQKLTADGDTSKQMNKTSTSLDENTIGDDRGDGHEELAGETVLNDTVNHVVAVTSKRIPFILLCRQLMEAQFIFDGSCMESPVSHSLLILDFPNPPECSAEECQRFKNEIVDCSVRLDAALCRWVLNVSLRKPSTMSSCCQIQYQGIKFDYEMVCLPHENKETYLSDRILSEFKGLIKVYNHATKAESYLEALKETHPHTTMMSWKSYDLKSLSFTYPKRQHYNVTFSYIREKRKYSIKFSENGASKDKCPHYLTEELLTIEFNQHDNLHYILKVIESTYLPLQSITNISIIPSINISNRVLSVVNNFTIIAHTSDHVKLIYRNVYVLDIYLMESSVLIRDGTLYRTDATKAMRGFNTIMYLSAFLQQYADKYSSTSYGHDFPVTPGSAEYDHQNDPHDTTYKDRSMKSPAVVISSPQPYNQFTSPSPGNPVSVPSPGTFLQPSPAPLPAMSPNTWPGSPPVVQGSPITSKQGAGNTQSRHALSSINVSHAPVSVILTHAGFKLLLTPSYFFKYKFATSGRENSPGKCLCPLERFFGSVLLRSHLIRVLRTDDTLKTEKLEHGVVVFSGTGKSGPENGLQYSVQLDSNKMDHLVLKITTMKGYDAAWSKEDLQILEQFFERKVVCFPYKMGAMTAYARILGAQPKIMKDFIRIMKLELQQNWTNFRYRLEWCLTIPPSDSPTLALPGTPAVVLKTKNLIFLQLTSLQNEENTVTITLVHDLNSNAVSLIEFPKSHNFPKEPQGWPVRARAAVANLLQHISDKIAQKDQPIYCSIVTILSRLTVV